MTTKSKCLVLRMPRLYETEDTPADEKLIWAHFFLGDSHWYAAEFDGKDTFFGYAVLNGDMMNSEWGYFSLAELTELLALLANEPAARPLFDLPLRDRLALLLGEDLAHSWTAAEAASRLGVSESTLRRRLSDDHTTFRSILRGARMGAAHRLLEQGHGSQAACAAVGYASRTHFARHFRAAFGVCPSHLRQGRALQSALGV